ncbi:MAG TPA: thiol reductant ABC exporter subunit CydD [Streptosporangiaceae bacterium]
MTSTRSRAHRRLLAESRPARRSLAVAGLAGLAVTGFVLAQAWLLARVLAGAVTGPGNQALRGSLLLLVAVVAGRAAAVQSGEAAALRGAAAVKERLRTALARHVVRLGPAWASRQRSGEVTALAAGGLDALDPYYARYLPQFLLAVVVPVAVLTAIAVQDWISALIIAATLPLIPVFGVLIGLQTRARTERSWRLLARLSGHFLDVVQGLATLKMFGRTAGQERVIAEVTEEYRDSVMATLRVAFLSALVLELSASLATALVAVEVGLRLLYGHLGYQAALFVLLLTPEAYLPLRNATAQFHASADGLTAAGRAFEILDTPAAVPAGGLRDRAVPDLRDTPIRLDALTVAYQGRSELALDGAGLTISPGDRIVVTGPNGAGKTTLLLVLLGFVAPSAGTVSAGGVVIAGPGGLTSCDDDGWRAQIGWLPQHPTLFAWSVADNIALGRPGGSVPAGEIERAARLAGAAEFIAALPDGYETVLGERGLALSAGQRQKIALARLFLRDAPLLLLDEPTAHLDPVSAAETGRAIADLTADRTVVMITHDDAVALPGARTLAVADGRLREVTPSATPDTVVQAGAGAGRWRR